MFEQMIPYVFRQRRLIFGTLTVMLLLSAATLVRPWPLQMVVDHVLGSQPAPDWMVMLLRAPAPLDILWFAIAIMVAAILLAQGMGLMQSYLSQRLGQRLVFNLRCDLYAKLQYLSLKFHDNKRVGDLIYRITGDATALQNIVTFGLIPTIVQSFTLVVVMAAILAMDYRLALIATASLPFLVLSTLWFSKRVKKRSRVLAEAESALYAKVSESLSSIRAVKAFATEHQELSDFEKRALDSQDRYLRLVSFTSLGGLLNEMLMGLGTALVVLIGAMIVLEGDLTVGELLVFYAYLPSLHGPTNSLARSAIVIQRSRASLDRIMEVFNQPDERAYESGEHFSPVRGAIGFENVSFSYLADTDENRPSALSGVFLDIAAGERIALVGRSGSGKTTLLSLLMRFYTPQEGQICLDGHDISRLDLPWVRRNIALVLQDPILFSSSIGENIAYGRRNARQEELEGAAAAAGLDEFIRSLPDGYATQVGERGVRLSGGQRQRISIARAFLKQAPILVLDEPTSSLDATTERQIFSALDDLSRGRTTIIVAHRLTTARRADRIIVLHEGSIVERGSHDELMSIANGRYAGLWNDQTSDRDIDTGSALVAFQWTG